MANKYYDSTTKTVVDGEIAQASDLNTINTAIESAFDIAAADIIGAGSDAEYYAGISEDWAITAEDTPVQTNPTTEYSSLHHAAKASASATAAASSASSASSWETKAEQWAENPEGSAVETGKYSALHHKEKALDAQTAAETAQSGAETAETNAQAWAAEDEDVVVSGGLYSALHYSAKAADAQTAAETAQDAAETAYDDFDDRYLGAKSSDPALDNDGDALVTGALYYNTTAGEMKVYTGSAWTEAYVDSASYVGKDGPTGAAQMPTGTTAQRPGSPAAGDLRFNTTEGEFEGHDGSEWKAVGAGVPIGTVIMWVTNTAPEGYLKCNGATYAYNTYPELGALLGGSPGGNFTVPNINFAKNSKGTGTLNTEAAGVGTHNHTSGTNGGHNHTTGSNGNHVHDNYNSGSHAHTAYTSSNGNHYHSQLGVSSGGWLLHSGGTNSICDDYNANTSSNGSHTHTVVVNSVGTHDHGMSTTGSHTHTVSTVSAHSHTINNHTGTTQPACTLLNFCIKAE